MNTDFKLSLIDSHCDTAFELYHKKQGILKNNCHISLEGAERFHNYAQFFAVWSSLLRLSDQTAKN